MLRTYQPKKRQRSKVHGFGATAGKINEAGTGNGVLDAINGAILENYVVSEIIKTYSNSAQDCLLHYYRDKNSNEIDLIMESDGQLHPIEIKKSINPPTQITGAFKLLDKASVPRGTGAIICLREALSAIDSNTYIVPVWMI